ncbi:MAG: PqqD family protein [bacterium]|nr:PqqD family protein [bacterium]
MELSNKVRIKKEELAWREIEGEVLLLHLPTERYYILNKVGSYIWKQFDGNKPISEIIDNIKRDCDVAKTADVSSDLLEFVTDLLQEGLIALT